MSGLSNAIVLDPDPRAGRQLQLGFEREGLPVQVPAIPDVLATLTLTGAAGAVPGVIVVGGTGPRAVDLLRHARTVDAPILFAGSEVSRADAHAAGADEIVTRPAYLRDVVILARLVHGLPAGERDHFVGSLAETTTVFALVRALAALGRSGVLTLMRGLRRGEVRFFGGEVTSAQVGLIHGQAAFHQLLLWTDARFDFHREDLVRRQQIPLPPDELFADAERFLEGVRESSGALSPATILEQDVQRVHSLGKLIPTEVHGVLRMFDGHRVLADILEDSPYRVFETLRVAQKAVEVGLLRTVVSQRPKATWRAVLAIEEWLVGSETREAVVERTVGLDATAPVTKVSGKKKRKRKSKTPPVGVKAGAAAGPPIRPSSREIDWGALVPRVIGAEVGPLSGVVPALGTHGEIESSPTRDVPREGLEALMDTDKRERIFPKEVGLEPSVVVRADDDEKAAAADADAKASADAKVLADAKAAFPAPSDGDATELRDASQARVGESVERMRIDRLRREEAEARAREEAARTAAADEAKQYAARVKVAAESRRLDAERKERDAAARADVDAGRRYDAMPAPALAPSPAPSADARAATEARARDEGDRAAAKLIAMPAIPAPRVHNDAAAAVAAASDSASPPRERTKPGTDARDLVKRLVAEAIPPAPAPAADSGATTPFVRARIATPITVAETLSTTVSVADTVTVVAAADTAHLTASPVVTIKAPLPVDVAPKPPSAAPVATEHEPSDGVVRAMIATIDTAKLQRQRQQREAPQSDDPALKETTGEIAHSQARAQPARGVEDHASIEVDQPSMLVEQPAIDRTSMAVEKLPAADDDPALLVSDLAAVHAAAARAAATPPAAAPPHDAASASGERAVAEVRRDAVAFSDAEEAFFKKAETGPVRTTPKHETFDDLDEGYEPPKFWDRVFGRKKPPPPR